MSETLSGSIPPEAKMVLIGGGTYVGTSRPLLEMGVDLSGKQKPNVLIVPTPKNREADYDTFARKAVATYRDGMGTNPTVLHDFGTMPSFNELEDHFSAADVLYVSGGNTRYAMEQWQRSGIDKLMIDSMRRGAVITGISAGALSWFKEGLSDSQQYEVGQDEPWDFQPVRGMGQIDVTMTPHFNSIGTLDGRVRSEHFREFLEKASLQSGTIEYGLGIDDQASLVAIDGLIKIARSKEDVNLHVVSVNNNGSYHEAVLDAPAVTISKENTSADQLPNGGITWADFYKQLGKF